LHLVCVYIIYYLYLYIKWSDFDITIAVEEGKVFVI
jgi:hypothetical protein